VTVLQPCLYDVKVRVIEVWFLIYRKKKKRDQMKKIWLISEQKCLKESLVCGRWLVCFVVSRDCFVVILLFYLILNVKLLTSLAASQLYNTLLFLCNNVLKEVKFLKPVYRKIFNYLFLLLMYHYIIKWLCTKFYVNDSSKLNYKLNLLLMEDIFTVSVSQLVNYLWLVSNVC